MWTCANGSRKRILILILHTQILLYSPTGLCYSTLRRQKAKRVSCFWPQQTLFLCESSFPLKRVELWLGNSSANCSQGMTPALALLRWSAPDGASRDSQTGHLHVISALHFTSFVFLGKTNSDGVSGAAQTRGGLWELSMNLATFRPVSTGRALLLC